MTKIFHPNISKAGEICVNTLKKDWSKDLGIGHVLQVVRCLLINPFPESALNDEAGRIFMEDYDSYFKKARMMTEVHALVSSGRSDEGGGAGVGCGGVACGEGGAAEKKARSAERVEAERRRVEKKKSIKRL